MAALEVINMLIKTENIMGIFRNYDSLSKRHKTFSIIRVRIVIDISLTAMLLTIVWYLQSEINDRMFYMLRAFQFINFLVAQLC